MDLAVTAHSHRGAFILGSSLANCSSQSLFWTSQSNCNAFSPAVRDRHSRSNLRCSALLLDKKTLLTADRPSVLELGLNQRPCAARRAAAQRIDRQHQLIAGLEGFGGHPIPRE